MLQITLKKSKSKAYGFAFEMMLQLGAVPGSWGVVLNIAEHDISNSYNSLMQLIELIGKWKSVSATFRGERVNLFRFVFQQYNSIAACGSEKTQSQDENFCTMQYDIPSWGCRLIQHTLLYNTGNGNYERSGIYWYNYGFFSEDGTWIIDKERIYARIVKEVESKALDICPYFSVAAIEKVVFRDLPDYIIPDNYSYRLHYEKIYEGGREYIRAVNIRHINNVSNMPGTFNSTIVHQLTTAHDFFKAIPPDLPNELKTMIKKEMKVGEAAGKKAFDKQGMCKN